jgi:CDGSH-type Zn-finger protein
MAIKMVFSPNGSIVVGGDLSDLKLTDSTGQPIDISGQTKIWLCRCGQSKSKPFCDGSHEAAAFDASGPAAAIPD